MPIVNTTVLKKPIYQLPSLTKSQDEIDISQKIQLIKEEIGSVNPDSVNLIRESIRIISSDILQDKESEAVKLLNYCLKKSEAMYEKRLSTEELISEIKELQMEIENIGRNLLKELSNPTPQKLF